MTLSVDHTLNFIGGIMLKINALMILGLFCLSSGCASKSLKIELEACSQDNKDKTEMLMKFNLVDKDGKLRSK